jgi:lipopolysaccharide/colanic/teichoic acid biosynthesis glycosyltransferase
MIRRRFQDSGGSKLLFFSEMVLIAGCFFAAGAIDLGMDPTIYFLYEGGVERVFFAGATILVGMYFHHLYADVRVRSRVVLLQKLCEVFGAALIAQSLVAYVKPDWILPRWLMIYGALFSLLAIFLWRVFYSQFVLNIVRRHRIVFVGQNRTVKEIAQEIANSPGRGYEVLGYFDDVGNETAGGSEAGKWLGPFRALPTIARKARPDRIVVGIEDRGMPVSDLLDLHYERFAIEEASQTYEAINQRVSSRDVDLGGLIYSHELSPSANQLAMHKAIDRMAGAILFILAIPLMLLVALGLWAISRDPVLVRLPRGGYQGKVFQLFRFRGSPGLGSLYRRLHLDALPELINVLRGEMALVGPRAEMVQTRDMRLREIPLWDYRYNVPPGMTGWAQVNLMPLEQEQDPLLALEFDLYYIKHMSQTLNLYILMTTLKNRLVWADQEP